MHRPSTQYGFTLLELLIVLTLMVVIVGFMVSGFRDFARFQEYNQAVSNVSFVLQQAQTDARAAIGDSAHGVHIGANSITVFTGDTYSAADPNNVVISYSNVTFAASLADGGSDVRFAKLTGLAQATGTVSVVGLTHTATTTLTVTKAGIIE